MMSSSIEKSDSESVVCTRRQLIFKMGKRLLSPRTQTLTKVRNATSYHMKWAQVMEEISWKFDKVSVSSSLYFF